MPQTLAKLLTLILDNQFTVSESFDFSTNRPYIIKKKTAVMDRDDNKSLLCSNDSKKTLKKMLSYSTKDSLFTFINTLYLQIDG